MWTTPRSDEDMPHRCPDHLRLVEPHRSAWRAPAARAEFGEQLAVNVAHNLWRPYHPARRLRQNAIGGCEMIPRDFGDELASLAKPRRRHGRRRIVIRNP